MSAASGLGLVCHPLGQPRHRNLDQLPLYVPLYTAVELTEDAVGILDAYVSSSQRNARPQSPRPNSCWWDEPITGEQATICLPASTSRRSLLMLPITDAMTLQNRRGFLAMSSRPIEQPS